MIKLCLLTNEMYPFLPGGIGRLMYNFCMQNMASKTPVELHYLLPATPKGEQEKIRDYYAGKATIHFCPELLDVNDEVAQAISAEQAFHPEFAVNYKDSISYYHGLLMAEAAAQGGFDLVEVADMGGWGQAIIAAKRAGMAFQNTQIACRLHSSIGIITEFERYHHHPSTWFSAKLDLERQTILGADIVVGHVPSVVQQNARHYNLGEKWADDVIVEFPPILLDTEVGDAPDLGPAPDFVFSSRLQPFKRPDVFIRAAVLFMERHPDYAGCFRVMSYGWDDNYIAWLQSLVPLDLREKVVFQFEYSKEERNTVLKNAVIVVPSNYESLCLFAYESSIMRRPVILAGDCAAFGDYERWQDGENCLLFDGSFISLADVMEKALEWQPKSEVSTKIDQPYWERLQPVANSARPADPVDIPPDIPVVYYGVHDRFHLNEKLVRHAVSPFAGQRAYFLVSGRVLESRAVKTTGKVSLVPTSGQELGCDEVQHFIAGLGVEFVFLVRGDHRARPAFLHAAAQALQATPGLDLFASHVVNVDPFAEAEYGVTLSTGQAPGMAMLENTVAPPMVLLRVPALKKIGFDPQAGENWFEVFARKLALGGGNVVIAPNVLVEAESRSFERGNSKKLSAGVMDDVGLAAGLAPRLLGMDVRVTNKRGQNTRMISFGDGEFASAECVWPFPNPRDFGLVMLQQDNGGLLTHPLNGHMTVARLAQKLPPFVKSARLDLRNASAENQGVDFGLVLSAEELTGNEFDRIAAGEKLDKVIVTPWQTLKRMGDSSRSVALNSDFPAHIYLAARLPEGVSRDDYCWAIWKGIVFFQ